MRSRNYTRMLVEAGIMIGLAYVLNLVKVFEMPQGGSVTAGSMIPILIFAFRWGIGPGFLAGGVFGLLQLALGGYIATPVQALLDYPIAFAVLGLAGLFATSKEVKITGAFSGIILAMVARFAAHVVSGAVFFAEYAPEGINPWIYSMTYNGGYMGVEALISFVVIVVLAKSIKREMLLQA
ncbi:MULTISPECIES: energy-coupled thiamine transporter ThiT [unclassified Fusibacter]|uniref:energy-coupled thiamine transporter ThiT n=1 Tax=unclassified Fusibacter TaxID=2624464 RepID=UPI0010114E80|nr:MULTISPECIES: energy-coupled thiamine transporter ThiT [unclassified Fusibacter]MCK8059460.1 energy-coupled thiamine transporter ThiT [Fusibacter sp. A2]NPE21076.1 energy-coupled thiamine transporter ThiT [Fusibacter sp. A1]RXV62349.1 energy-coupled thiamine transporter ThiT [Fusibacter sp. A1]